MQKILLQRIEEVPSVTFKGKTQSATLGCLYVYDEKEHLVMKLSTCENGGPSTDTPNQDKRIVARDYILKTRYTNVSLPKEYKHRGLWLCNPTDSSFDDRFIMIHIGNAPSDTEGCILLGQNFSSTKGLINSSRSAITEFYKYVFSVGPSNFYFRVKEIK